MDLPLTAGVLSCGEAFMVGGLAAFSLGGVLRVGDVLAEDTWALLILERGFLCSIEVCVTAVVLAFCLDEVLAEDIDEDALLPLITEYFTGRVSMASLPMPALGEGRTFGEYALLSLMYSTRFAVKSDGPSSSEWSFLAGDDTALSWIV